MNNCTHQFVDRGNNRAVCVYCGQVREVYVDGRIVIVKDSGVITSAPNGNAH